jgi:hypothetical protein
MNLTALYLRNGFMSNRITTFLKLNFLPSQKTGLTLSRTTYWVTDQCLGTSSFFLQSVMKLHALQVS